MKRTRNAIDYKVKMWFYRLTLADLKKWVFEIGNGLSVMFALIALFVLLFIVPALFH